MSIAGSISSSQMSLCSHISTEDIKKISEIDKTYYNLVKDMNIDEKFKIYSEYQIQNKKWKFNKNNEDDFLKSQKKNYKKNHRRQDSLIAKILQEKASQKNAQKNKLSLVFKNNFYCYLKITIFKLFLLDKSTKINVSNKKDDKSQLSLVF